MRIEPSNGPHRSAHRNAPKGGDDAAPRKSSRVEPGLPAVRPEDRQESRRTHVRLGGSYAPVIAQLIATRLDMPQTRARRRAAPEAAIRAYGSVAAAPGAHAASRLVRSV